MLTKKNDTTSTQITGRNIHPSALLKTDLSFGQIPLLPGDPSEAETMYVVHVKTDLVKPEQIKRRGEDANFPGTLTCRGDYVFIGTVFSVIPFDTGRKYWAIVGDTSGKQYKSRGEAGQSLYGIFTNQYPGAYEVDEVDDVDKGEPAMLMTKAPAKQKATKKVARRTNKKYKTREDWLVALIALLHPEFKKHGYDLPKDIRVSCGWTSTGARGKAIGEVWSKRNSEDGVHEIFISPKLSDAVYVGGTLVHELCHLAAGMEAKHGPKFKVVALAMGLTGKMTATIAGEELAKLLKRMVRKLGAYPHGKLEGMTSMRRKQGTRLVKVMCPECGYIARVTRSWLDTFGAPICPADNVPFTEEY